MHQVSFFESGMTRPGTEPQPPWTIGKHSSHYAIGWYFIYVCIWFISELFVCNISKWAKGNFFCIQLNGYILCLYRAVVDKFWLVILRFRVRVKGSIGKCRFWFCPYSSSGVLLILSLLFQWCPFDFVLTLPVVRLISMVFEMDVQWLYSCCSVGCCCQDLFNIAHSILVQ